jgi:hypothetical protein
VAWPAKSWAVKDRSHGPQYMYRHMLGPIWTAGAKEVGQWVGRIFFLHFTFFSKNIWSGIFFQNCISSAVGAEAGTYRRAPWRLGGRGTVVSAIAVVHGGRGPICFEKIIIFLFDIG